MEGVKGHRCLFKGSVSETASSDFILSVVHLEKFWGRVICKDFPGFWKYLHIYNITQNLGNYGYLLSSQELDQNLIFIHSSLHILCVVDQGFEVQKGNDISAKGTISSLSVDLCLSKVKLAVCLQVLMRDLGPPQTLCLTTRQNTGYSFTHDISQRKLSRFKHDMHVCVFLFFPGFLL